MKTETDLIKAVRIISTLVGTAWGLFSVFFFFLVGLIAFYGYVSQVWTNIMTSSTEQNLPLLNITTPVWWVMSLGLAILVLINVIEISNNPAK